MTKQHLVRREELRLSKLTELRFLFWGVLRAAYNTPFPWRATLLIFAVGPVVHTSFGYTFLVYVGYLICAVLDQFKKDHVFEDEMDDWEEDPDQSEYETKGNLSRVKLTGQNQIVAYRVASLLNRMP